MESRVLKTGPTATGQYEATFRPDSCTILKNYKSDLGDPSWVLKKKKHCSEKKKKTWNFWTKIYIYSECIKKRGGLQFKGAGPLIRWLISFLFLAFKPIFISIIVYSFNFKFDRNGNGFFHC